jgi:hypothetical protein
MEVKMAQFKLLTLFVLFGSWLLNPTPALCADEWTTKEAKQRLLERKQGFEAHLRAQELRRQRREAKADQQRLLREKYAQQKAKARQGFQRPETVFPYKAHKLFIAQREQRRQDLEAARRKYSQIQKGLQQIRQDKKYQIDGNREFDL